MPIRLNTQSAHGALRLILYFKTIRRVGECFFESVVLQLISRRILNGNYQGGALPFIRFQTVMNFTILHEIRSNLSFKSYSASKVELRFISESRQGIDFELL